MSGTATKTAKKSPITVYAHRSCGGCRALVPVIKKLAKKKHIPVKIIDLEKCKSKKCDSLQYTPYIVYRKKEVKTSQELAKILGADKV